MGAVSAPRVVSKVLVEAHEDAKRADDEDGWRKRQALVEQLTRLGVPVTATSAIKVDLMWTVDGVPCAFDVKTPTDVIASALDGRLHHQLQWMEEAHAEPHGLIVVGQDSADGVTVGYGAHAWEVERYDDLLLSLQCEGSKVVRCEAAGRLASRIARLYRWTAKTERASWRAPIKPSYSLNRLYGDKHYRAAVEGLMALLPGAGEERANLLLDRYTMAEVLGADGVDAAELRWRAVPGIGPKLCAAWRGVLQGDYRLEGVL